MLLFHCRHSETWWTGVHMVSGKCGWIEANKMRFDTKPLDTLKHDLMTKLVSNG